MKKSCHSKFLRVLCACLFLAAAPAYGETGIDRPLRTVRFNLPDRPVSRDKLSAQNEDGPAAQNSLLTAGAMEQALTQQYIRQYSSRGGVEWLNAVMRRGSPYIPFIRKEIAERGLPPELLYLPVIESGYLSTAVSKSGAAGLWQFMKNSIGGYDITITDWVDERRDFWKATQGALRKLNDNYKTLEDWSLALAAYNAGLGAVSQAIKKTGLHDYWALSEKKALKTETIHYVPKLLAVSHILSHPRLYGVDTWIEEAPEWTRVPLSKPVDLAIIAEEAGIDIGLLKNGNHELNYNISPPSSWQIKVPLESADAVAAVMERNDIQLIKNYLYTISAGDTLSDLAKHYGVSVNMIENANPGIQSRYLKLGAKILVPALKDVGPYQSEKKAVANAGASGGSGASSGSGASGVNVSFDGAHLVKRGETLWSIALANNIDPETLAQANNMNLNDTLSIGRSLKVPKIGSDEP